MRRFIFGSLAAVLFSTSGFSQTDTIEIEEIIISGQRIPEVYSRINRVVDVIQYAQIRNAPAQSIQEVLEYAPGIDIRQRGGPGVQGDLSIRGGSFDQSLILLNGMKINDPQSGHHNLNIPVDISDVTRIEILQGPGSRVFGPNAFSGAINLITSEAEINSLKLSLAGGQYGYYRAGVSGSFTSGRFTQFASVNKKTSTGFRKNTDFDILNLFYHGSVKVQNSEVNFQAGHINKSFGAQAFYTPRYPNQFEEIRATLANLDWSGGDRVTWNTSIYWRRHKDRFELFRDNPEPWYSGHNYHRTDVLGTEFSSSIQTVLGKTEVGIEYRTERILSNVLGELTGDSLAVRGEADGYYTKEKIRNNASLFIEQNFTYERFSISAGIMANWNGEYDSKVYSGGEMSYQLTQPFKLFFALNQSLRLPTFTDLYYSGPTNQGNPLLLPEEALSIEAGLKYTQIGFRSHISFFARKAENLIDWVRPEDSLIWESRNLTTLNTIGFEYSGEFDFSILPDYGGPLKYIRINYTYMHARKQSGHYISYYLMDYLKHKVSLAIQHTVYHRIAASWNVGYQDRAGSYTDYITGKEIAYSPLWLIDTRIGWQLKRIDTYLEVSNLLNRSQIDFGNIPTPGRWIRMGMNLRFNFQPN